MTTEERLRAALREGAPRALDGAAIAASARRRRALGLARVGAAAGAVVLVAGIGLGIAGTRGSQTATESEASLAPAAPAQPPPAGESTFEAGRSETNVVPGHRLEVLANRWCLVATDGSHDDCVPRAEHSQRLVDDRGNTWLVVLVPSGPGTMVLQVEQSTGWVPLSTSAVPDSPELWLGVLPSERAPEPPRVVQALDAEGQEIWRS